MNFDFILISAIMSNLNLYYWIRFHTRKEEKCGVVFNLNSKIWDCAVFCVVKIPRLSDLLIRGFLSGEKWEYWQHLCGNLSTNQHGQRVILAEFKKITFQHYQVRLEDQAGARAGRESGADIAVLLVELDLRVMGVYAVIFHSS